jgi:hypothetical protein
MGSGNKLPRLYLAGGGEIRPEDLIGHTTLFLADDQALQLIVREEDGGAG